jgi:hypothetical protein
LKKGTESAKLNRPFYPGGATEEKKEKVATVWGILYVYCTIPLKRKNAALAWLGRSHELRKKREIERARQRERERERGIEIRATFVELSARRRQQPG